MKKFENHLDEQQEQQLLRIEHNGCWLAFWGLLAAILVQSLFFDGSLAQLAGEWIVFMVLCIYMAVACARRGIWDRTLKMDRKTNLIVSAVAAVVFGLWMLAMVLRRAPDRVGGAIAAAVISAVVVFAVCLGALTVAARATKKRLDAMEAEPEEADEIPEE